MSTVGAQVIEQNFPLILGKFFFYIRLYDDSKIEHIVHQLSSIVQCMFLVPTKGNLAITMKSSGNETSLLCPAPTSTSLSLSLVEVRLVGM